MACNDIGLESGCKDCASAWNQQVSWPAITLACNQFVMCKCNCASAWNQQPIMAYNHIGMQLMLAKKIATLGLLLPHTSCHTQSWSWPGSWCSSWPQRPCSYHLHPWPAWQAWRWPPTPSTQDLPAPHGRASQKPSCPCILQILAADVVCISHVDPLVESCLDQLGNTCFLKGAKPSGPCSLRLCLVVLSCSGCDCAMSNAAAVKVILGM
mmetsp:Transcript_35222/g.78399  ORF Transcript_35222/g.78399 Transcript_35222/m.78399 type:complete len:210 (-) Transcript_35222:171-800(-)